MLTPLNRGPFFVIPLPIFRSQTCHSSTTKETHPIFPGKLRSVLMDCALRHMTFDFNPFLAVLFSRLGSVSPVTTLAKIRIYGNQRAKKTQYSQAQCCSENVQSLICAHLCCSKRPAHHVIAQVNRSELIL